MPRYLVERDFGEISEAEMQEFVASARLLTAEKFPEIQWEGSHVCDDEIGGVKAFCVYTAPSAVMLREHAERLRGQWVQGIHQIDEASPFTP